MKLHDVIAKKELYNTKCDLNHYPYKKEDAIDYLCQKFYMFEIRIPICQECIDALNSDVWILLYCINCCKSQWIYLPNSKKPYLYKYGEHVKWLKSCPMC